jgi:5-methyltetrahydrofolate--homocysteine methyltransferase
MKNGILPLLTLMNERVVVFDGAMGTSIQQRDLTVDDFAGHEGLNELLVVTRPDVIRDIHASYFAAGADVVETNTFGSNRVVLAEYGMPDRAYELSRTAAELAVGVARDVATPARPRFVCGSIGPGTKLPTVGHIGFRELRAAFEPQAEGLLDGGVDLVIIETCQDLLQAKAAWDAVQRACQSRGRAVPVIISVTIEATGTMLIGADVGAAMAALRPLRPAAIGLNCATGPDAMKRHVQALSQLGPAHISAMPNAGLPKNVDGQIVYPMGPAAFADWVEGFVREEGVGIVGGCCGTTPEHIAELVRRVGDLRSGPRRVEPRAEVASLYQAVSLHQVPAPLLVGERLNANGSKEFRDRLLAEDLPGMLAVAREQEKGGAHVLDVCVAYVGRDERADMDRLVPELARMARLPLMLDSTDPQVLEAALERIGGRPVINSINLEDGRPRLDAIVDLAKRFGAALVALTIDEEGMARGVERKLAVAERIFDIVVGEHGLAPQDLVFDLLTFTVASGDPDMRRAAADTLDAIAELKRRHPDVQTILGVSNVSFGLKPAARRVLNSVFLALAVERGLDAAIVNARGILPLHRIEPELRDVCTRLLLADWSLGDPLAELLQAFAEGRVERERAPEEDTRTDREKLRDRIVDGEKQGVPALLDRLLADGHAPLALINETLIPAMKIVGDLFGSGQMQLPFVLQSAEVMKSAVAHLEPHLASADRSDRGTIVLATVKGDVHDIGKNLVDIILSNNGFRVINLGIKVTIEELLRAAAEHRAQAIGMSGLLVKSTIVMRENLQGGAALTREYVERTLRGEYGPDVHYGEDAFEGLRLLTAICGEQPPAPAAAATDSDPLLRPRAESDRAISLDTPRPAPGPRVYRADELDDGGDDLEAPAVDHGLAVPTPPFLGARVLADIPLGEVYALLNETTLFRGQWRYRRGTLSREDYAALIEHEVRPILAEWKERARAERLLVPRAVYGYWRCHAEGRTLAVHDPADDDSPHPRVIARFPFPRRRTAPHWCISDFFRPGPEPDLVGLLVVTVGPRATEFARERFAADAYRDYLHVHGLSVEAAEATAEWVHRRMRQELGIADEDRDGEQAMVRQGYRGSRYSFGYPACPDLALQRPLFELLGPERVDVRLTEGDQMDPEQSVSAIVVHHPQAKYFTLD